MSEEIHDYVVIGGGSGGSVVAGRLSEDPALSVCVLEAGGDGRSAFIRIPMATVAMMPRKLHNWALETVPQEGLNGRRGFQPRGKALGGSSAINAMVYARGHASDYDDWAALGNRGWSFAEVLPYFLRSENNERYGAPWHGQSGPLSVSESRTDNPFHARYLEAARQIGLPINEDFNGAQQDGVGVYQLTQKNGERCSAAHAYLLPHLGQRKNLVAHTGTLAQRIVFEDRRAVGVEVLQHGMRRLIRARREVVLAAGAFQSPQLLMLSGIGDAAQLREFGIPLLHHLPGVGAQLQDHPDFIFGYKTRSLDTFGFSPAGSLRMVREFFRYRSARRGAFTTNFAEAGGFLRTRPELSRPNVQLHFVVALVDDHGRKLHYGHGFSCHVCLLRPRSVGSVRLASDNAADVPLIDPAFLKDPRDLDELVEGFKLTRQLMQAPALAEWITQDLFTANVQTDDEIRAVLRARTDTVYHPIGTCKMGIGAESVVDPELRVRGVTNLRVVDAAVMPTLIGGNTNAPTIMIAEKAVDMMLNRAAPTLPEAVAAALPSSRPEPAHA